MLLCGPEGLCAFVCVPAVLHFHDMNRSAIELLDSIPLTGIALLWLSRYRGDTCPT
jgi:hypothetical protein